MIQSLQKMVWKFLLKLGSPYNPALHSLAHIQRNENLFTGRNIGTNIHSSFIYKSQIQRLCKYPSMAEWLQMNTMEYYLAVKRNKLLIHVSTCMIIQEIILSERNQSQKDTNRIIYVTFVKQHIYRDEEQISGCQGLGTCRSKDNECAYKEQHNPVLWHQLAIQIVGWKRRSRTGSKMAQSCMHKHTIIRPHK